MLVRARTDERQVFTCCDGLDAAVFECCGVVKRTSDWSDR
jgi:hypothetical protein